MPGLTQVQVAVRYLEQAQGVGAVCSLRPESVRRLPVGLDGRLSLAQAFVAIAEQVEEIGGIMLLRSGRTRRTFVHCHGGPSGWADVPCTRPTV